MTQNGLKNGPNFSRSEMACKETGEEGVTTELMNALQALRNVVGVPLSISSGFRSANHSVEKAKDKPGTHAQGKAVDIICSHTLAYTIISHASDLGFTGIGVKQSGGGRFLHLDVCQAAEGPVRAPPFGATNSRLSCDSHSQRSDPYSWNRSVLIFPRQSRLLRQ